MSRLPPKLYTERVDLRAFVDIPEKHHFTTGDLARLTGLSVAHVKRDAAAGLIPEYRKGQGKKHFRFYNRSGKLAQWIGASAKRAINRRFGQMWDEPRKQLYAKMRALGFTTTRSGVRGRKIVFSQVQSPYLRIKAPERFLTAGDCMPILRMGKASDAPQIAADLEKKLAMLTARFELFVSEAESLLRAQTPV
jgi:hypothetical protein